MRAVDPDPLRRLASKYVWWKTPEEAVSMPERVVAQVMNIGDYADVQALAALLGDDALRAVLTNAQAGQFNERSWTYWHYRLNLASEGDVPDLPVREFADGDLEHSYVKVSFFGMIGFGRVGSPSLTEDGVMQVADLDDLMATKVKVILQRAEAKDYRDIAAMIGAGVSLPRGLAAACQFFGSTFQPSESLKALVYFNDGDLRTLTKEERASLVRAASAVRDLPEVAVRSKELA